MAEVISLITKMSMSRMYENIGFVINKIQLSCLFLLLVASVCESCKSNSNKVTLNTQSKTLLQTSENCDVDLPYSSVQSLDSLCKLCANYIRDYPELYGQCR